MIKAWHTPVSTRRKHVSTPAYMSHPIDVAILIPMLVSALTVGSPPHIFTDVRANAHSVPFQASLTHLVTLPMRVLTLAWPSRLSTAQTPTPTPVRRIAVPTRVRTITRPQQYLLASDVFVIARMTLTEEWHCPSSTQRKPVLMLV